VAKRSPISATAERLLTHKSQRSQVSQPCDGRRECELKTLSRAEEEDRLFLEKEGWRTQSMMGWVSSFTPVTWRHGRVICRDAMLGFTKTDPF